MSYQADKFREARRGLMLCASKGEAHAIAEAFFEISLAIRDLDPARIPDEAARAKLQSLRGLMDVSEVKGHAVSSAAWVAKAKGFSAEQKQALADAVDGLADWFGSNPAIA